MGATNKIFRMNPSEDSETATYRITADAIVGKGNVFRVGQTVTDEDLDGFGELFADWGAVEKLGDIKLF